jgi:poly(hydroxyalkanoate) depolymerase family esterase
MARRTQKTLLSRSYQRALSALTRAAVRAGSQALKQTLGAAPGTVKRRSVKAATVSTPHWSSGFAVGVAGARRYWLYQPPGVRRSERLPLVVMLHGCGQNAEALAASSRMNRIAARERFFVLYPEQDRLSNAQACWNWYDTRSGRAQGEAGILDTMIDHVCRLYAVDGKRIAVAGLSAGAGMAALLAIRHPQRFRAVVMHSGVAPGVAHSSATALGAMRGHRVAAAPLPSGTHLPALLVIHGSADHVVAPSNAAEAVRLWAAVTGAKPAAPRTVQRGARYAATITSYLTRRRVVATLCEISGLGHAWSGGGAGRAYSDPQGPDASRMIWTFIAKQFAGAAK